MIELEKTSKEIKSKLTIARDSSIESIAQVADAAQKKISDLSVQVTKHTQNAAANFDSNLDSSLAISRRKFEDNLASSLTSADNHLKNIAANLAKDLEEWRKLQEEAARVKEHILPGQALLSVSGSIKDLKNVDLSLVARLFTGLSLWFETNLAKATVRPSSDMQRKDSSLSAYYDYKLSVLVELVSEGVKEELLAENKNVQMRG